jgi:hypothetical protein
MEIVDEEIEQNAMLCVFGHVKAFNKCMKEKNIFILANLKKK